MASIKNILSAYLDVPFSDGALLKYGIDDRRKIRLVNYLSLVSVGNMILYVIFYSIVDFQLFQHAIIFLTISSLITIGIIFLNRAGFHLGAKLVLCILTPLIMGYIATLAFGKGPGFQMYLFVATLIPLFLWDWRQKWYPIIIIFCILILYTLIEFYSSTITPRIILSEQLTSFFRFSNIFICFLAAGIAIGIYQYLYRKKEIQLIQQAEELKISQAHKDKVYSIIAHDIRTPFATFASLTEILINKYDTSTDEERLKFIHSIHQTSGSLQNLLENLLEWSRMQSGNLSISLKALDLKSIAIESVDLHQELIQQKAQDVELKIDASYTVLADQHMLSTIFRNLLSNALKYTLPEGKITVSAREIHDSIEVCIEDNGIGMNKRDLQSLFDIKNSETRLESDSSDLRGLGLLLCKDFVEAHKGNIWVESQLNKGSSFYFTLPKSASS